MPAPTKRRRYKNLSVDRVDLVDRGANFDRKTGDGSHILLVKRDAQAEKQDLTCPSCDYRLPIGYGDRGSTLPNYCPDCGAKLAIRATSKQEPNMPPTAAEQTDVNKAIADALAKQAAETDAKIAKAVADATAAAEAKAATEKAAIEKRAADLEAEVKKANDAAAAEVEKREIASAVTKVASFPRVFTKADTDGPLFYRIGKALVAEDVARIEEIVRSADEQIRLGKLFAEAGRTGVPPTGDAAGNPEQQLFAKADELRAANPKLSPADAVDQARSQYPELRQKYDTWKSAQINPTAARA